MVERKGGVGGRKLIGVEVEVGAKYAPLAEANHSALRLYLGDQGIAIGVLADGCRVSKPYMNRIVNGRRFPSLHLAARIAAFLGVSIEKVAAMVQVEPRRYKANPRRYRENVR